MSALRWKKYHLEKAIYHLEMAEDWEEKAKATLRERIREELVR